ncbi:GNAT family N-acetyltransferase [Lacrimispora amygdalina]|uniref:GNAT family N-acetyltransferase n=2 Tax=Lacrimispora TaxID=2719231 RepID=UPI000BE2E740|nr:GNAT family N-acetyltransferase [Lacrimispora amygdalina]
MINKLRAVEDGYMELYCQKKTVQDISYFSNQIVPGLYDHNFILLENISNEMETIEFIREQLKALAQSDKEHLKIVIHPGIEVSKGFYDSMNEVGFDVDDLYYMTAGEHSAGDWHGDDSCRIKKAVTSEEIKAGVDCAITYAAQRMSLELSREKANQKKELYEKGLMDFYICYDEETPIGFCDWYEKDQIVKLEEVTILNEYQGKGFGTNMLKKLLYKAIKEEKKRVYIVTDTGEEHNIYLQLGFKGAGTETELFLMKKDMK